jgi:hypothetical protein
MTGGGRWFLRLALVLLTTLVLTNSGGVASSQEAEPEPSPSPSEAAPSPSPSPEPSPAPSESPQPAPSPSGETSGEAVSASSTTSGELPNPCEQLLDCSSLPPIQDCLPSTTTTSDVAPPDLCPPPPPPDVCSITTASTSNVELPPCVPPIPDLQGKSCGVTPDPPQLVAATIVSTGEGDCGATLTRVKVCVDFLGIRGLACSEAEGFGPQRPPPATAPCIVSGYYNTYVEATNLLTGNHTDGHSNLVWIACPIN